MARYTRGKHAFGFCDRSGLRFPLDELVHETVNGTRTGSLIHYTEVDPDHPQNFTGRIMTNDPQSLRNPRPDTAVESLFGFDPVGHPHEYMITSVGKVTVTTS